MFSTYIYNLTTKTQTKSDNDRSLECVASSCFKPGVTPYVVSFSLCEALLLTRPSLLLTQNKIPKRLREMLVQPRVLLPRNSI